MQIFHVTHLFGTLFFASSLMYGLRVRAMRRSLEHSSKYPNPIYDEIVTIRFFMINTVLLILVGVMSYFRSRPTASGNSINDLFFLLPLLFLIGLYNLYKIKKKQ
jgi:hypothetical protein